MKALRTIEIVCLGVILAGCAVGPNYHPPKADMKSGFGEMTSTNAAVTSLPTTNSPVVEWWRGFNDPELDHLIESALHENYNLRIALARVRAARYQRSIVAADLFPNIDADSGYWHGRGSENVQLSLGSGGSSGGSGGAGGGGAGATPAKKAMNSTGSSGAGGSVGANPFGNQLTPFGKGGLPGVTSSLYQVGFDSNWELDVFGGTRRKLEATAADLGASVEELHDVTVSLLAEVARNYVELRGTQQRLVVAEKNLAAQKETLELTLSRANAGLTSRADVTRAAAQVASTSATIPPLQASVRRSIHLLSTLIAREPMALSDELETNKPLVYLPPEVPVGLPSQLLERRPDIRRAERQMAAATARIGSAESELFPKFALTGGIGLDSTSTGNLFDWQSRYFFISPTVTWRVFDAGRIISNVALQKANQQESVWQYRNTILTALREVEDGLVAYATEQEHRNALAEALKQNEDSLNLIRSQYDHGLSDFLEVLDAQRNVLSTEDQLAQANQTLGTDLVSLYKSLGGGWEIHR